MKPLLQNLQQPLTCMPLHLLFLLELGLLLQEQWIEHIFQPHFGVFPYLREQQQHHQIADEGSGLFVLINYKDAKSYWLNKLEEKEIEPKSNRRVIGVGSQILRALDLKKITVLGTPTKYNAVSGFDIER